MSLRVQPHARHHVHAHRESKPNATPTRDSFQPASSHAHGAHAHKKHAKAHVDAAQTQQSVVASQAAVAAEHIAQAARNGGAAAGARAIKEQIEKAPNAEVAAAILKASEPVLDRIRSEIGKLTSDSTALRSGTPQNLALCALVKDLSRAAELAADAPAPAGEEAVTLVAEKLCTLSPRLQGERASTQLQTLSTAMASVLGEGGSAVLASRMAKVFEARGEHDLAVGLGMVVQNGAVDLGRNFESAKADYEKKQQELQWLISNWGRLMNPEQLRHAVESFQQQNHEVYDRYAKLGGAAVDTLGTLLDLRRSVDGGAHDFDEGLRSLAQNLPGALASSGGVAAMARQTKRDMDGESPLLEELFSLRSMVADKADWAKEVANGLVTGVGVGAQQLLLAGEPALATKLVSILSKHVDVLGVPPEQLGRLQEKLNAVFQPGLSEAQRVAAQKALCEETARLDTLSLGTRIGRTFRAMGAALGTLSAAERVVKAIDDPSVENVAKALLTSSNAGVMSAKFVAAIRGNSALIKGGLKAGERALSQIAVAFEAIDAVASFAHGDVADGALSTLGVAGSALALAGMTGLGAAFSGAAVVGAFAYGQYQSVLESNKHETDSAREFLKGAGLSASVADHLVDCDSDGRSAAPVLSALARRVGLSESQMLQLVARLPAGRVLHLVEMCHGVDYSTDKHGRHHMPAHAENDWAFGIGEAPEYAQRNPALMHNDHPHSLPALEAWFETFARHHHVELPGKRDAAAS